MADLRAKQNESTKFLSEALAALHQYVWLYLPSSGQYVYTSPALLDLLGLEQDSPANKHWLDFSHAEDREALTTKLENLQLNGEALLTEHRLLTADGKERWYQATIRLFTSQSDELIQAGILVDINDRKSAQERLSQSEQRFEKMFMNLSKAVILSQPDGSILMANPSATRLFGYSEFELIAGGRSLILDEQSPTYRQHSQIWEQGNPAVSVLTLRQSDGSTFQAEISTVPFQLDSGEVQLASLIRDLSREIAYSQTARQLYEISESMPGAIYQFCMKPDGHSYFPFMSRSAEHQWGYTADNLSLEPDGFLRLIHPEDREALLASTEISASNLTPWQMKFRGWDLLQGSYRWIRGHSIPSRQEDGSTLWNGTMLDINEAELNLQTLEAERLRLETILDSMSEGLTVVDDQAKIVLINTSGKNLLGQNAASTSADEWAQLYGIYLSDGITLCPTDNLPIMQALRGEQIHNTELSILTPSGNWHHLLISASPLRDRQNRINGAVSVYRDITALYLAEQQVRQTSQRMQDLLERFNLGFMTLSKNWQISFFNRAAWELSGRAEPSTLLNHNFWEIFPESTDPNLKILERFELARHKNSNVHFSEFYPPLDSWFDVNVYPYQGELDLFFEDITFSKRSQELIELEKELLSFQLYFDRNPQDILLAALKGLESIFRPRRCLLLRTTDWGPDLPWVLSSGTTEAETNVLEQLALPLDLRDWIDQHAGKIWSSENAEGYVKNLIQHTGYPKARLLPITARSGLLWGILVVLYPRTDWTIHTQESDGLTAGTMLLRNVLEVWLSGWRLRLSNERYDLASRATSDVIWDNELSSGVLTFNFALCQQFGYPESQLTTTHHWWCQQLHPQDRERVISGRKQVVTEQLKHWEEEYRFCTATGAYRYIYDRGYILYDSTGKPIRMLGSMQDVTEYKRAELQLRASETHLLASQKIAHVGSWEVDLRTTDALESAPVYWSDECYRIFGFAPRAIEPSVALVLSMTHSDDVSAVKDAITQTLNSGELYSIEHRILRPDGSEGTIWQRAEIVLDAQLNRPARVIGTVQDVTEQRQAEAALRDSNQRYELVVKATCDVIWDWDLIKQTLTFTESLQEVFGYPLSGVSQDPAWSLQQIHPDDQVRITQSLETHLALSQNYWQDEFRFRHANGSYRTVLSRSYTLLDALGQPRRVIGAMQDITTVKAHEQRIQAQNDRLLQIAWQQSHEVRRPLANLLGLIQLIESRPAAHELLSLFKQEALSLDQIIAKIVTSSEQVLQQERELLSDP